jgi:hypothetical protein
VSRSLAFHARISLDFSLSLFPLNKPREFSCVCACFSGRADFHIPAARLLVGNYYQDAERENIVAFVRCSSAIKKRKTLFLFSLFLFSSRSLFFFLSPHPILQERASTIFPAERNVNILRALPAAVCAVVARARGSFFIEMFYLRLLCRIIYYALRGAAFGSPQ